MRHDPSDLRSLILIQIIPKERTQKVRFSLKYRRTAHTGRMIKYEVLNNTDVWALSVTNKITWGKGNLISNCQVSDRPIKHFMYLIF